MTDPPGVPSALGIETVQWFAQGGDNLTVRVTGRWRRRRPTWSGQPVLVIEAQGQRHRFPAMPEPPSLTGTPPGTWRMSFSVPASLAPHLSGQAWLQLGAVVVPLPAEVDPPGAPGPGAAEIPAAAADPETLAQRRLLSSEFALQAARRRAIAAEEEAAELASRVQQLEQKLEQARHEPERLHYLLAERERATRAVEQRAYAERALREELQEQLAERARSPREAEEESAELADAGERIRELEVEIDRLRRQTDEAEQIAAAARTARERAEREASEAAAGPPHGPEVASRIRAELEVARSAPLASSGRSPQAASRVMEPRGLPLEREMITRRPSAPAPVISPEPAPVVNPPPAPTGPGTQVAATLAALREEFSELRTLAERESAGRAEAQARASRLERELHDYAIRCARAYDELDELRRQLEAVREAFAGWSRVAEPPVQNLDPERLAAALSRLREASPVTEPSAIGDAEPPVLTGAPTSAWLARVFRALTDRDAPAAGRLALALLPAQRLVHPDPIAYDLVLEELGCVQVSMGPGNTASELANVRVELRGSPRPSADVAFQVIGGLPGLARLLVAGRPRRRIRRQGLARVKGDRRALAALTALVQAPLRLHKLQDAGVRLQPPLALTVVSLMIDPSWTKAERFTIAYQHSGERLPAAYLHVRDGAPPSVSDSPLLEPVTTIVCSSDMLLRLLDGGSRAGVEVQGDERALALVQSWIKRAQSG